MKHVDYNQQPKLFDPWRHLGPRRRRMLDHGWPGMFRKFLRERLPVEAIAGYFHDSHGRPTKELHTVLGALVLQQLLDQPDAEFVEQLAFDERIHYALGIDTTDDESTVICERTLRNYRKLATDAGMESLLFEELTAALIKAFDVDTRKQRLDSTHFASNMREQSWIQTIASCIRKFLRNLKRQEPQRFAERIEPELLQRYLARKGEPGCFGHGKPSEANAKLHDLGRDLLLLVHRFRDDLRVTRLDSYKLLVRVLNDRFTVVDNDSDDDGPGLELKPAQAGCGGDLQNPSDPDAGRDGHKGVGYQAQIMETYQEDDDDVVDETVPDLITHVAVEPAHYSDAHAIQPSLEQTARRDCQPTQLLADTAYGGDANVQYAAQHGTELVAPTPGSRHNEKHRFTFEEFDWDWELDHPCRCPMGQVSQRAWETPKGFYNVAFDRAHCVACPKRGQCPVRIGNTTARLKIRTKKVRLGKRRAYEKTEAFRNRYRWRAGVEATMSRLKSQTGLGRLRVRGMRSVRHVTMLKALGLNILRASRAHAARKRAEMAQSALTNVLLALSNGVAAVVAKAFNRFHQPARALPARHAA